MISNHHIHLVTFNIHTNHYSSPIGKYHCGSQAPSPSVGMRNMAKQVELVKSKKIAGFQRLKPAPLTNKNGDIMRIPMYNYVYIYTYMCI